MTQMNPLYPLRETAGEDAHAGKLWPAAIVILLIVFTPALLAGLLRLFTS